MAIGRRDRRRTTTVETVVLVGVTILVGLVVGASLLGFGVEGVDSIAAAVREIPGL